MTMKTVAAAILLLGALAAGGCSSTSQAEFEVGQAVLKTDPKIRRATIVKCEKRVDAAWSAADHSNMAAVMNVSLSRASATFCNRVIKAIASGRISHADFNKAERSGNYDTIIRVMQGR